MSQDFKHIADLKKHPELKKLNSINNPPKELFIKGHYNKDIFKNCIAIVGSRRMTSYGQRVIDGLVPKLVMQNKTIVSGMMYGVDQYAHKVCLDNGGHTIGVLGWGIKNKIADYDAKLAQKIIDQDGLLISEWEDRIPATWTFPARNRIVAGLSQEVYVIEAALKSGSLITARLAMQFKRKLWAVPGPITSSVSAGTNALINQGKAEMYTGEIKKSKLKSKKNQDKILNLLADEPLSTDEIARRLNEPIASIGAKLSMFALEGVLSEQDNKFYLNK